MADTEQIVEESPVEPQVEAPSDSVVGQAIIYPPIIDDAEVVPVKTEYHPQRYTFPNRPQ